MCEINYPIGIQTFSVIRNGEYPYVDKTAFIKPLISGGKFYFLSRPRRFGKSLLLSTLEAYFEGRRELFKNLAIDRMDVDWTPRPVLHFDFNSGLYGNEDGLTVRLNRSLADYEERYGIINTDSSPSAIPTRFEILIKTVCEATGREVVILVDEYDKPLLGFQEEDDRYKRNQPLLKAFYGVPKSLEKYVRFMMLTGVARFSKISIFSDTNQFRDISLSEEYAEICGWTESELVGTFRKGIEQLAGKRGKSFEETLKDLRIYYDGYRFTAECDRLYNPFSVLNSLADKKIEPYWYETGTPTFLVKSIRENKTDIGAISEVDCTRAELTEVGLNPRNPLPLLFQTGYLTIDSYEEELEYYHLRFPNYEVEHSFANNLLTNYIPEMENPGSQFKISLFKRDLVDGRPEAFMNRLQTLVDEIPYDMQDETGYQNIVLLLTLLCGTASEAERHVANGRPDLEVMTRRFIYIFEFKFNRSVREAMDQILSRGYADRHRLDQRSLYIIGANFIKNETKRGLEDWDIQKIR